AGQRHDDERVALLGTGLGKLARHISTTLDELADPTGNPVDMNSRVAGHARQDETRDPTIGRARASDDPLDPELVELGCEWARRHPGTQGGIAAVIERQPGLLKLAEQQRKFLT